jgi:polyhydroxyalkanoate synthesis repressor PhaR
VHLIKKYANRKLYHTNRKQYITLDGIGELIQRGEEVRVIDNESSEDITASILAQVVLQARGRKSALPTYLLTDMIQAGSGRLAGLSRSVWTAIGGMSPVDDEIMQRIQTLQDEGMIDASEAARMQRLLVRQPEQEANAGFVNIPTANDIARLNAQVDALTGMVEQLLAERTASKPRPPEQEA